MVVIGASNEAVYHKNKNLFYLEACSMISAAEQ